MVVCLYVSLFCCCCCCCCCCLFRTIGNLLCVYVSDVFHAGQARDVGESGDAGGKVRGCLDVAPGGGEDSHMLVDIDCLSLVPSFTPILHTTTPFFYICKEFDVKILKVLRALRIFRCKKKYHCSFSSKFTNCGLKMGFCTPDNPNFWELTPKRSVF